MKVMSRGTSEKSLRKTNRKEALRTVSNDTHVKDLDKWIDPTALPTVSLLVGLVGDLVQQRGKDWNKNEAEGREWEHPSWSFLIPHHGDWGLAGCSVTTDWS
jgi:hypothetical protein